MWYQREEKESHLVKAMLLLVEILMLNLTCASHGNILSTSLQSIVETETSPVSDM